MKTTTIPWCCWCEPVYLISMSDIHVGYHANFMNEWPLIKNRVGAWPLAVPMVWSLLQSFQDLSGAGPPAAPMVMYNSLCWSGRGYADSIVVSQFSVTIGFGTIIIIFHWSIANWREERERWLKDMGMLCTMSRTLLFRWTRWVWQEPPYFLPCLKNLSKSCIGAKLSDLHLPVGTSTVPH